MASRYMLALVPVPVHNKRPKDGHVGHGWPRSTQRRVSERVFAVHESLQELCKLFHVQAFQQDPYCLVDRGAMHPFGLQPASRLSASSFCLHAKCRGAVFWQVTSQLTRHCRILKHFRTWKPFWKELHFNCLLNSFKNIFIMILSALLLRR